MDHLALTAKVAHAYEKYLAAFIANDLTAINAMVQYPFGHIGESSVGLSATFPFDPGALKRAKQWHSTRNSSYEVVALSPRNAHVTLRCADRLREDGSLIETVSGFYAFTCTPEGWKLFAMSAVVNAA